MNRALTLSPREGSTWCKTAQNVPGHYPLLWLGTFWAVLHQVVPPRDFHDSGQLGRSDN